jgi:integrase
MDETREKQRTRRRRGRGEGAIYQREDGTWTACVSLGYNEHGKRKRRVVYGSTKKEVQDKLREMQERTAKGTLTDAGGLTVGAYLDSWFTATAPKKMATTTLGRVEELLRLHLKPIIGHIRLDRLTSLMVEQCYAEMERRGAGKRTQQAAGVLLGDALNHAVHPLKLIPHNPAFKVAKARPEQKEMRHLNADQAKQFLAAARQYRLYALFALAIGTGMRQGELLGLQWPDIDFERGTITVKRSLAQLKKEFVLKEPKTKASRRTISLPPFVLAALRDHRKGMLAEGNIHATVFCTKTGTFIAKSNLIRQTFRSVIRRTNEAAKKEAEEKKTEPTILPEIRFHDLRHTHATMLLSQGASLKAVSQRLGHSRVEMTLKVYAHVLPTDDANLASAAEKMFG